jgi:hypothetical protein
MLSGLMVALVQEAAAAELVGALLGVAPAPAPEPADDSAPLVAPPLPPAAEDPEAVSVDAVDAAEDPASDEAARPPDAELRLSVL